MERSQRQAPNWLLPGLLTAGGLLIVLMLWRLSSDSSIGKNDFVGYWSATYLFRTGQNPYDRPAMDAFQRDVMMTGLDDTVMAWNPPSLFAFLLPLSWLSFSDARSVWLIINMAIIVACALILARLYLPKSSGGFQIVCLLMALTSPQILSGVFVGQVTFLVLLGLVGCIALIKREQWIWAGAALILVTIKPHLVVLPGIYLLLYMYKKQRFQGWLGLLLAAIFTIGVLSAFRPTWISDLAVELSIAPVHWATPTIGGLLSHWGVTESARSMLLLFLPLPFFLLGQKVNLKMETAVALLILVTLPVTFFGWSFDQALLLIPIVQVLAWMSLSGQKTANAWLSAGILLVLFLTYYQRVVQSNDVYYVWVPLAWLILFFWAWHGFRSGKQMQPDSPGGSVPLMRSS